MASAHQAQRLQVPHKPRAPNRLDGCGNFEGRIEPVEAGDETRQAAEPMLAALMATNPAWRWKTLVDVLGRGTQPHR